MLRSYWKASVSSESWINMMLWYPLVGVCVVVLLYLARIADLRNSKWPDVVRDRQVTPRRIFITRFLNLCLQVTVFLWTGKAEENGQSSVHGQQSPPGSDRRLLPGATPGSGRYRLGPPPVDSRSWLNVQSGYHKPYSIMVSGTHVIRWIENWNLGSMGRV